MEQLNGTMAKFREISIEEVVPLLIREGAHTIWVPIGHCPAGRGYNEALRDLKYPLSKRLKPVNYDRTIAGRVQRYFQPVEDWILSNIKKNDFESRLDCFALNEVSNFLYLFKMGIDKQAQVGLDIQMVSEDLMRLAGKLTDIEARIRLEQVAGIINLYEKSSVSTLTYTARTPGISMIERIEDLLDEGEIVEMSKRRHSLGVPRINTELHIAWLKTKLRYRKLLRKRKYRRFLRFSKEIIRYISKHTGREIPKFEVPFFDEDSYRPPVVDVEGFLANDLKKKHRKHVTPIRGFVMWLIEDLPSWVTGRHNND